MTRARRRPTALLTLIASAIALALVIPLRAPLLIGFEIPAVLGVLRLTLHQPPRIRFAILGSAAAAEALAADLARGAPRLRFVGRISTERQADPDRYWIGVLSNLRAVVEERDIHVLVLCSGVPRMRVFDELDRSCRDVPVRFCELSAFYEDHFQHIPIAQINSAWFQCVVHPRYRTESPRSKRIFDVVLALALAALAAPVLLVLSLLIRLDGGPALYRQVRVGERGKPFTILKLRTMRQHTGADTPWTRADDDRVTPLGAFLRRAHIDELPQLVNVLRGEMSIVGPRPEQPSYVAQLERTIPFYSRRHQMRPGLTGWAQIRCGYGGSEEGTALKVSHDLYYLKHRGLRLDAKILALTIATAVRGKQFADLGDRPLVFGFRDHEREPELQFATARDPRTSAVVSSCSTARSSRSGSADGAASRSASSAPGR